MSSHTKKEIRELKKLVNQRTQTERQTELNGVFNKFQELGISCEIDGINEFYKIAIQFIEDGKPISGKIKIDAIAKDLHYLLNNNKKHQIQVLLREMK